MHLSSGQDTRQVPGSAQPLVSAALD